jgi:drug/metabolite transporter (DMT)-like permease
MWMRGAFVALAAVLILSPDTLLIRLSSLDAWTVALLRGSMASLGLFGIATVVARRRRMPLGQLFLEPGVPGVAVMTAVAGANLLFVISITHTAAANSLVITASMPLIAAILSWVFLRERISRGTWAASVFACIAIALVFSASAAGVSAVGNLAALGATWMFAVAVTVMRHYRNRSFLPAICGGYLLSATIAASGASADRITYESAAWLALDGLVLIPIALSLLILAPKYISAPDVGLFNLLETVLGPLWIWLVLREAPPTATFVAGVILVVTLGALLSHQNRVRRRQHALEAMPQHL